MAQANIDTAVDAFDSPCVMTFMVPWLGVGEDFAGKGLGGRYTITSIPSMTIGAQLVELHSGQRVMHAVCDSGSLSS
ncbi:hypothetical protein N7471_003725 [Penicillium samsonianum]|uniref:uncharacterized protein n=1 Tax=Penicillium samsonianum TaxID=1882272 RepID=UPI00254680CE|nr:uncharacterized protein N7471_003725 [Penicillium samsonianum]KAJ6137239.1 hypothetical protein N7471_003725 [Penicillium samsonianum]